MKTTNHILKPGFSLLEIMFALVIMVAGFSTLFSLLPRTLQGAAASSSYEKSLELHESITKDVLHYVQYSLDNNSNYTNNSSLDPTIDSADLDPVQDNVTFVYHIDLKDDTEVFFNIKGDKLNEASKKSYYKINISFEEKIVNESLEKEILIVSIETAWPYIQATGKSKNQLKSIKTLSL